MITYHSNSSILKTIDTSIVLYDKQSLKELNLYFYRLELTVGIEPTTRTLQECRSAYWATSASVGGEGLEPPTSGSQSNLKIAVQLFFKSRLFYGALPTELPAHM